jgi:hypothetical protein
LNLALFVGDSPEFRILSMEQTQKDQLIQDLILALAWLTSWKDTKFKDIADAPPSAWKSYDWDALDQLVEKGYIYHKPRNKSLALFPEGVERAQALVEKLEVLLGEKPE